MPAPSEIGILTFHRCINYGSYWQARCLVEGLKAMGRRAVLMDHRASALDRAEWRCALAPVPGAPSIERDRRAYAAKTRRFFDAFDQLPMSAPFPLDRPAEAPAFELVVVGSDEVWNLRHPWYGGCPIFYGEGLRGERVSYAASFGNQSAGEEIDPYWRDLLRSFSAIAVRDQNARRIVADATRRPPPLVLDPCLQFPEMIDAPRPRAGVPYVAVYGHAFPDWFAAAMRAWAHDHDLALVSIGYRNDWADRQWIDAGPLEFPGFMAGASAVATNFFHGCVFALLNGKPFVCASSAYRSNKISDLLALVRAPARLMGEAADVADVGTLLGRPADPGTDEAIEELRLRSQDYLRHVLN